MRTTTPPALTFDEIDDLLYFTRANEVQDLQETIRELAQKYQCTPKDVLEAAIDAENGNTVLHYCSANGLIELLPTLLSKLGDAGNASSTDGFNTTKKFVNHPNKEGNTPLHWAAYNGHLPVVKLLVAAGADMWIKNAAGHLAMFEAERADKNDVVQYLLEAGGNEVEQAGAEGQPAAEDIVDVQEGEASSSAQARGGADLDSNGTTTNG